jgi:hypothetical protein
MLNGRRGSSGAESPAGSGSASRREEILAEAVRQLTAELRDLGRKHEAEIAGLKAMLPSAGDRLALKEGPREEQVSPDSAAAALAHQTMAKALRAELDNCIRQLEHNREAIDRSMRETRAACRPKRRFGRPGPITRLSSNLNAIFRHPINRDKRREFRGNQLAIKNRAKEGPTG